jgi:hypothetical protein
VRPLEGCRGGGGRVGSVTYRDVALRTTDGWRLGESVGVLRCLNAPRAMDDPVAKPSRLCPGDLRELLLGLGIELGCGITQHGEVPQQHPAVADPP